MQIAVHLDASGQPASLAEAGRLCLYEQSDTAWTLIEDFPFRLPREEGIPGLRRAIDMAVSALSPCRVLLSNAVNGYAYSLLQEQYGFSVWKSSGSLAEQLAAVVAGEEQRQAEAQAACGCDSIPASGCGGCGASKTAPIDAPPPVELRENADGSRHLDLIAAMAEDQRRNSRNVLGPLLAQTPFRPLTILMAHQPRWFRRCLNDLDLAFTEERRPDGLFVTVTASEAFAR